MAIKSYQACNPIIACHPKTFKTHQGAILISWKFHIHIKLIPLRVEFNYTPFYLVKALVYPGMHPRQQAVRKASRTWALPENLSAC